MDDVVETPSLKVDLGNVHLKEKIGVGSTRNVFKISDEYVEEKENINCFLGYCLKIKKQDQYKVDQNRREVELYHGDIISDNKKQYLCPIFDWGENYEWILQPILKTDVGRQEYTKFKRKVVNIGLVNFVGDIQMRNVGKKKKSGTLHVIDYGRKFSI